jgi:hypothetical protein
VPSSYQRRPRVPLATKVTTGRSMSTGLAASLAAGVESARVVYKPEVTNSR